jgi:DMSO/TMAO reductase YedYZ heme-binding membrane subunit
MKLRSIINSLIYYGLPIILLILSINSKGKHLFNNLGTISEYLLIIIMYSKPLCIILNSKILTKLVCFRRQLGVASFWFFFFHMAGLIYIFNLTKISQYLNVSSSLFYGALAAIGMLILTITSNDYSLKLLKQNWKKLQYIAYPTFLLVLFHISMAQSEFSEFIIFGSIFIILKTIEWTKNHSNKEIKCPKN